MKTWINLITYFTSSLTHSQHIDRRWVLFSRLIIIMKNVCTLITLRSWRISNRYRSWISLCFVSVSQNQLERFSLLFTYRRERAISNNKCADSGRDEIKKHKRCCPILGADVSIYCDCVFFSCLFHPLFRPVCKSVRRREASRIHTICSSLLSEYFISHLFLVPLDLIRSRKGSEEGKSRSQAEEEEKIRNWGIFVVVDCREEDC